MTMNWDKIRKNYKLANQAAYFESAYFGALSDRTTQVQIECLQELQSSGSKQYALTMERAENIRQTILEVTNANHHHAALISDVSTPMSHLAHMFFDKEIL